MFGCIHECEGFEIIWFENGSKYTRNTNVPRWMRCKEDLRGLLRLKETILKMRLLIDPYVYLQLLCIFFVIYVSYELLIKQKKKVQGLSVHMFRSYSLQC